MPPLHTPSSRVPYELTDERSRIDLPWLMALHETAWWAQDRAERDVQRAPDHSHPVTTTHRGRGIGTALIRTALERPDLRSVSYFPLLTKDRHAFHERPGFPAERETAMVLRR